MRFESNKPDFLIFVGPKTHDDSVSVDTGQLIEPDCPVFYLSYDAHPWVDLIGSVVRQWKGIGYMITNPRDLAIAWTEVMFRLWQATLDSRHECQRTTHESNSPKIDVFCLGLGAISATGVFYKKL
jgi:hypothetical protein